MSAADSARPHSAVVLSRLFYYALMQLTVLLWPGQLGNILSVQPAPPCAATTETKCAVKSKQAVLHAHELMQFELEEVCSF